MLGIVLGFTLSAGAIYYGVGVYCLKVKCIVFRRIVRQFLMLMLKRTGKNMLSMEC